MQTPDWSQFAEKVHLAVDSSLETHFERGLSGLELEFNLLDHAMRPVTTVGYGPGRQSFADYLLRGHVPEWIKPQCQLEVFHWMAELVTQPYYDPLGTAIEGRLLEAVLLRALDEASLAFGESFYALHGNLPFPVEPSADSIPDGWDLAKKKYLARCVDLFGSKLATAGIHTNHSYPEALLSWDFFHLPQHRREGQTLIDFRNAAVIRATKLLRPFTPLFIGVTASTPLGWEMVEGEPAVVLTRNDSNRLLTFPNPPELDVPYLYASHQDYLRISYDLVRRGVRFGANNWTPVRARSDVDPVNRNIWATAEQLAKLYHKGLYRAGEHASLEEAEKALLVENLCARVDLPMSRVEVRTDEGGDTLALSAAKIAFKEVLMLRIYADPAFGAAYAYDAEDIARARRNEDAAARRGLEAVIEDPFAGGKVTAREFLKATMQDLAPTGRGPGLHGPPGAPARHGRRGTQPRLGGAPVVRGPARTAAGRRLRATPWSPGSSSRSGSTGARPSCATSSPRPLPTSGSWATRRPSSPSARRSTRRARSGGPSLPPRSLRTAPRSRRGRIPWPRPWPCPRPCAASPLSPTAPGSGSTRSGAAPGSSPAPCGTRGRSCGSSRGASIPRSSPASPAPSSRRSPWAATSTWWSPTPTTASSSPAWRATTCGPEAPPT